jgi:excisionase family DNA binding protein
MSVNEAAAALNISRQRVHQLLQAGMLQGEKISGTAWLVMTDSVNARKEKAARKRPSHGNLEVNRDAQQG